MRCRRPALHPDANSQGAARFQDSFLVAALDSGGASVLSGTLTVIVDVDAAVSLSETVGSGTLFGSILWNFSVGSASEDGRTLVTTGGPGSSGGRFVLQIPWADGTPIPIFSLPTARSAFTEANPARGQSERHEASSPGTVFSLCGKVFPFETGIVQDRTL